MDFDYGAAFGKSRANGYERLLLEAMPGVRRCLRIVMELRRPGRFIRRFLRLGLQFATGIELVIYIW